MIRRPLASSVYLAGVLAALALLVWRAEEREPLLMVAGVAGATIVIAGLWLLPASAGRDASATVTPLTFLGLLAIVGLAIALAWSGRGGEGAAASLGAGVGLGLLGVTRRRKRA